MYKIPCNKFCVQNCEKNVPLIGTYVGNQLSPILNQFRACHNTLTHSTVTETVWMTTGDRRAHSAAQQGRCRTYTYTHIYIADTYMHADIHLYKYIHIHNTFIINIYIVHLYNILIHTYIGCKKIYHVRERQLQPNVSVYDTSLTPVHTHTFTQYKKHR